MYEELQHYLFSASLHILMLLQYISRVYALMVSFGLFEQCATVPQPSLTCDTQSDVSF